jgi:ATP-binding cassette, subfamily C (CFTR/MRP), member 1
MSLERNAFLSLAFAFSIPVLATTLAFVTYTLTSHDFDVAVIFASLNLFQVSVKTQTFNFQLLFQHTNLQLTLQLLRQPLIFLPRALSATADAQNAIARLKTIFHAELRGDDAALTIDPEQKAAVVVRSATFQWEDLPLEDEPDEKPSIEKKKGRTERRKGDELPFQVRSIDIVIPRGQLVAIVGPVGSGKVLFA